MDEKILSNIVRVGTVSAVDTPARKARVLFPDTGITSGWLFVIQHLAAGIYVDPDNEHTHEIADTYTGGGSASLIPDHYHPGSHLTAWMPKVGDKVLTLFVPVYDGDGFILGGI